MTKHGSTDRVAKNRSNKKFLGAENVDAAVLVNSLDVPAYVGLPFTTVHAVRTLEARFLSTLVTQMSLQRAFPNENARTIRTGKLLVSRVVEPYSSLLVASVRVISRI